MGIRTRNLEWGTCFYWNNFAEAFDNWYAGEILEVNHGGVWVKWPEQDRINWSQRGVKNESRKD